MLGLVISSIELIVLSSNVLEQSGISTVIVAINDTQSLEGSCTYNGGSYFKGGFKVIDYHLETTPNIFDIPTWTYVKASTAENSIEATGTNAFKCSTTTLAFTNKSTISFSQLNLIAEAVLEKPEFPSTQIYELCQLDSRTSDVMPIVVGACLARLVVIVLIAHLIGRAQMR